MKHKIIVICIFIVIALGIALGVWLIPRQIETAQTFQAVQVTADGTVMQECSIELHAVKRDYLLKNDNYKSIEISVPGYRVDTSGRTDGIIDIDTASGWEMEYMSFLSYIESEHCPVELYYSFDGSWCVVTITPPQEQTLYYIGTVGADADPMAIWERWPNLFD